ncbi:MAG: hypothetical protein EG823_01265 [Actinobacteria bacterium]|nr:hypothetical protein [Actinomycetota bacterium]
MSHVRKVRIAALLLTATLVVSPAAAYADHESDPATDTTLPPTTGGAPAVTPTPAPVVVVRAYATSPERVTVGSAFDLTLTLYNATNRRADNVVVSLGQAAAGATATPAGLAVLGTGNAKYLGTLKGQKEASVAFRVMVPPGTTPGALTVPVTVSFEHQNARQEVAYTIGVLAERDAVLTLVSAELPDSVMVGETFDASFEIGNASGYALSGVVMSVEAEGAAITDGTLFLGSMDAATTEAIDVTVTPEKPGPLEVTVMVKYRDDFGREQTFSDTRTVQVDDAPEVGPVDGEVEQPAEERDGGNWFVRFIRALFGLGS